MSPDNFDRHIRKQLQDHRRAVDAEEIWAAVAPQKPRRRLWLWWVFGLLLPLSIVAYLWQQESSHPQAAMTMQEEQLPSHSAKAEAVSPPLHQQMAMTDTPQQYTQLEPMATKENSPVNAASLSSTPIEQAKAKNPVEKSAVPTPHTAPIARLRDTGEQIGNAERTIAKNQGRPERFADVASPSAASPHLRHPNDKVIPPERASEIVDPLNAKPLGQLAYPPLALDARPLPPALKNPNQFKPSSGFFLNLGGGLYAPVRSLQSRADSSSTAISNWLAERNNTETTLEAWSLDLYAGYQHPSGWYLQTGVGYSQLIEQYEFSEQTTVQDSVEGVVRIIINNMGDSSLVHGLLSRTQTNTFYQRNYNSFRQLDIPLLFGYRFGQDRLSLQAEGGIRLNIQQEVMGVRRSLDTQIVDLAESEDFRTSVGLSLQAGIGLSWQWTPRISLSANTSVRYFMSDVTKPAALLRERYQWLGGQIGIRFYF